MRTLSNDLRQDIMDGTIVNVMKITMKDGTIHAFTDYDQEITVGGQVYVPAPGLQKIKYTLTADAEVSNQEFGAAWVDIPEEDLASGAFDDARVEVAWASWKNPAHGKIVMFTGLVGELVWSEEGFKADIVSSMKNLSKTSFTFYGQVSTILTSKWKFDITGVAQPTSYFSNGQIKFLTGNNAGLTSVIKKHTGSTIELFLPTAFVINPTDQFEIVAGRDLTLESCRDKFNNVVHFGGFPHIQPDVNFR